jgi:DNA-binding NarL/FixJ family response regulator
MMGFSVLHCPIPENLCMLSRFKMTKTAPVDGSSTEKIRIMTVDDHFMVRTGLASSINFEPDMKVVAEAATGQEASDTFDRVKPDITLMDLRLPGMTGAEATAHICKNHPEARIIVLSTYNSDEDIYRVFQAGARSYLLKTVSREELLSTIRSVHAGKLCIPPALAERLAGRTSQADLTPRELEVLKLIMKGHSNKEIGAELFVSEVTVKMHVSNLFSKLHVTDRTRAATTALRRGIVQLDEEQAD